MQSSQLTSFFDYFESSWCSKDYARALFLVEAVLHDYPDYMELLWYRCCCLEKLGHHQQALDEAWVKHEEQDKNLEKQSQLYDEVGEDSVFESEVAPDLNDFSIFQLTLNEMPADFCELWLNQFDLDKTLAIYNHLIDLEPGAQQYAHRAQIMILAAHVNADDLRSKEVICDPTGVLYDQSFLEKALADYKKAAKLDSQNILYRIEAAGVQHLLGRYNEALTIYDEALALFEVDAPQRKNILEMRSMSEEQAQKSNTPMVDSTGTITGSSTEKYLQDEEAANAQTIVAAESLLTETSMPKASADSATRLFDNFTALNIARQIYSSTYEPEPQFVAIDFKELSSSHKNFIEKTKKQLNALKCEYLGTYEALGWSEMLGKKVAVGLFLVKDHNTVIFVTTLEPKWFGLTNFLWLLMKGQWRNHSFIEMTTWFNNGCFIITSRSSTPVNFDYGSRVHMKNMSVNISVVEQLQQHQQLNEKFLKKFPETRYMLMHTLTDIEEASCYRSKAKNEYRQSIGYVTEKELQKLLGHRYEDLKNRVRRKLQYSVFTDDEEI